MDDLTLAAWLDVTVLIAAASRRDRRRGARIIHERSSRAGKPFVTVRCGRADQFQSGSDLACQLVKASTGTVFLDDVDQMSGGWQEELSAFLESQARHQRDVERVKPSVRIIAGTAANVASLLTTGGFDAGLFYRLNVLHVELTAIESGCVEPEPRSLRAFVSGRHTGVA